MKKILIFALILATVALPLNPTPVYAATQSRALNGAWSYQSLGAGMSTTYAGGGSAGDYTDLNSNNADTSYQYILNTTGSSPNTAIYAYPMQDFTATYSSINSVTLYVVARKAGVATLDLTPLTRIGATNYEGTSTGLTAGAYNTYSKTWNTSPATGLAWTKTTIDAADWGFKTVFQNTTPQALITYMYLVVDYAVTIVPDVTSVAATSIAVLNATLNGSITDNISGALDHRGFVYDPVSRAAPGNVAPAASGYVSWWTDNSTGFAPGAFVHITGGLTANTDYYFRAFAHNAVGWAYGDELTFHTVGNPTVSIVAASNVATTTARLNAQVTNANGQPCDIRFGYDIVTRANVAAYANITAWVNDTYNTGDFPFVDVAGLTAGVPYFFRVEIRNDAGSAESGESTFTTFSGISKPTNLQATSLSTSINLSWIKGSGSARTLVRYSFGTYPNGTAIGTLAYLNTGNTATITGLTPGTSVFISAWGENGGIYSPGWSTVLITTIPYSTTTGGTVETPPVNNWMQAPDASGVSTIPLVPGLIQANATAYGIPLNMLWYFLWSFMAIAGGIITFRVSDGKLAIAVAVTAILFGAGASVGLTMLVIVALFLLIAAGFIFFGDRRN